MARRWVLSVVGALVLLAAVVTVAALTSGGRSHDVAQQARTTPSPFLLDTPVPSTTPKPHRTARKHHAAASGHAAVQHRSTGGHSGVPPADPCAHNHHCYVPPLPPLKPNPDRPPIGPPVATVSGVVVPPPTG